MIAAGPGIGAGQRSNALMNLIDVGATFLDYAGVSKAEGMTALSFRPFLEGTTRSHREFLSSGLGGWRLVCDGQYKLVRGFGPSSRIAEQTQLEVKDAPPMLFDLKADPLENHNLAAKAPEIVARLAKLLPPIDADPQGGKRPEKKN